MVTGLEFDDTREEIESICLYNLYEKGQPVREISKKL
jgi:hypothetical protein